MADIRIEKDKNKPVWPWILALLVLVALGWWIFADSEPVEPEPVAYEQPILEEERVSNELTGVSAIGAVSEFTQFVEEPLEGADMGLDHEYTSDGILRLQNALVAIAEQETSMDAEIQERIGALEEVAREIQTDPYVLKHADKMHEAFVLAAELMDAIQEDSFLEVDTEVTEVMEAAHAINPEENALDQKDKIRNYFVEAKEALEAMDV
ncbi:hypothetical protein [Nafulsella turpanensis]|uniref:hypothetical protein n=1 Tax=Nafulsella turpanensis TaxID=1265690 RepID=UPI0003460224|nr:hypothetical protein [Nafulsella turpanensis]